VITDMTMPSMTGIELAPKLIDIRPGIPIILCSGFNELVSEEKVKAIGIKAYVQKPLDLKVLGQTVRNVLENKPAESTPSVNG
jgi:YesN/AraC family two-component response regulator